jgi:hypothetical protein
MSTNIHFGAIREIRVIKTGKIELQRLEFDEWYTPTEITNKIMCSDDKIAAYKEWVLSTTEDVPNKIYHPDDIFAEGETIAETTINVGKDHVAEFEDWIRYAIQEGYDIQVEAW